MEGSLAMPLQRRLRTLSALLLGCYSGLLNCQPVVADDHDLCSRSASDPNQGIPACTRLLDQEKDTAKLPGLYNNRGVAKVTGGDYRSAIDDFTQALNRRPTLGEALKNRGIAWQMLGDFDRAVSDFTRALRLDGRSSTLLNARGSALFNKEEYDRAITDFDAALASD